MIDPAELLSPALAQMQAYAVQDASGLIKLDAMENPFPMPAALREDWGRTLSTVALNRYPDPAAGALKAALLERYPLPDGWRLLLGNGSDELLQLLCLAVAGRGRPVLAAEPSFVMYRQLAMACGLRYCAVPLRADFALDMPAMLDAVQREQPALVFIAQPNNPTGHRYRRDDLQRLCAAAPGLVIIDEAYLPYAGEDATALAAGHDNVLLVRTLSKWGLAGLRLGFLGGPQHWVDELEKLRLPYNIGALTQAGACFALDHGAVFDAQVRDLIAERERLSAALEGLGHTVFPSAANFLLCRIADARQGFEALRAGGVLVKCLDGAHPLLHGCLRLTIGTPAENDRMLEILAR